MEAVQQTQTIVKNVQAEADSMQEYDRMVAEADTSGPGNPLGRPKMSDRATGLEDTPLDVVHALNLIYVCCHATPCLRVLL